MRGLGRSAIALVAVAVHTTGALPTGHATSWADWVVSYRKKHNCGGQVQVKDRLSQSLYALARQATNVLEVGTWRGCGSTLIIAKGLIDGGGTGTLQTLEVNQERAAEAAAMTRQLRVVNVSAAPASRAEEIYPQAEVKSGALPPKMSAANRPDYLLWWHGEHMDAKKLEKMGMRPPIEGLCAQLTIDVAFLDGGEFFGIGDLHTVLRHCPQLRYIALDDTQTFKNNKPLKELSAAGSGWQVCVEDKQERHGWAVVAREGPTACAALH